jgi:hypothetical protein
MKPGKQDQLLNAHKKLCNITSFSAAPFIEQILKHDGMPAQN